MIINTPYRRTEFRTLILGAVFVFITSGACVAGLPFPIGIYGVPSTNDFPVLRAAGFNVVAGPSEKSYLDAARAAGLMVLASPPNLSSRRGTAALDRHPALWAWYLFDEPDLNLVSPAEVAASCRLLRRSGAHKPSALTLYQGYNALEYGNLPDILMVDRYPVPWLPLANLGQHVKLARLGIGKNKPLLAVIQAFDWSAYPQLLAGEGNFRPPTLTEMRCMAYDALARGANGLFFYEFDGGWKIREHPQVWEALKTVVREVNQRLPLFEGQPAWWPKEHEFAGPQQRFNEALESSVSSVYLKVAHGNADVPAGSYILAVNNTAKQVVYSFSLPAPAATLGPKRKALHAGRARSADVPGESEIAVLGEQRSVRPISNWLADSFPPYGVHIYGPIP